MLLSRCLDGAIARKVYIPYMMKPDYEVFATFVLWGDSVWFCGAVISSVNSEYRIIAWWKLMVNKLKC